MVLISRVFKRQLGFDELMVWGYCDGTNDTIATKSLITCPVISPPCLLESPAYSQTATILPCVTIG